MEMTTWRASAVMNGIFMYMLVLTSLTSGSKIIRTSAKSLAEKAGAAQYAVHIEEELTSAEIGGERKHRASFDDSDYDVYQGVVGRPGIDFPIQASIPQTAFSCALFGNGYFADLETKCQVFHICEGGKKISFLCPNGTIFQQTDLICDWWFRVNCANSPDYYAESSEILSRSQSQPQSSGGSFKPISVADMPSEVNQTTMASLQRGLQAPHATPAKLRAGQTFTLRSSSSISSSSSKHLIQQQTNPASSAYSAERFDDGGNLFALKTKDRNSHTARTSAARKLGKAAYETAAQFVPLDVLETQEVAESASFALGRNGHNNFVPIYVRSNVRLDTSESPQSNSLSNRTQHSIQTNVNIINYLHTPPNDRVNVTKRTFTATATATTTTTTTTAPPISRRGTVMYAGPATKTLLATNNNYKEPSTVSRTTPNQIHYTESHPKGANKTPRRLQKQRSTQYYTPTVPTIIARSTTTPTTTAATTVPPPFHQDPELPSSSSSSSSASSDHAIEMMRILNELMRGNRLLKQNAARLTSGGAEPRSLALYFATGDDNSVSPDGSFLPNSQVKFDLDSTNALDVAVSNATNIASSLLSNDTIRKYDRLFETMDELPASGVAARDEEAEALSLTAAESANDKRDTDTGNNDVLPAERTPEIRSLAQVFTHALSAYLHDPSTFRQVLSDIRPTEPPTLEAKAQAKRRNERRFRTDQYATTNSFLINTGDDLEVLDFSDVTVSTQQNEANFPSTTPAPNTARIFQDTETTVRSHSLSNRPAFKYVATADHVPASRLLTDPLEKSALSARSKDSKRNPLALEINGAFVVSTSFPYFQDDSLEYRNETNTDTAYSTQSTPASTIYQTTEVPTQMQTETPAFVQLPNLDPFNFDDNDLQRSASASFVGSGGGNGNNRLLRPQSAALGTSNFPTTTPATTTYQRDSNQRSTLAYTVFLDPLTINDELLLQSSPVTPSLHTYLPKSSGHTDPHTAATTDDDLLLLPTTTESSFISRRGKYFEPSTVTAAAATNGGGGGSDPELMDLMQERANEMFGSLNNTSAAHLMNVMKKANKNKTVRKLILLLIQTCDEDYSTTVEQSRTALLNALIGMDSKFNDSIDVKVISPFKYRRGKSNSDEATAAAAFEESVASGPAAAATTTVVTPQATGRSATDADAETTTVTSFFDNNDEDNHRRTTVSEDPFDYYTESSALFETDETLRQAAAVWSTTYAPPTAEPADPATVWTTVAAAAETTTTPAATTTTTTTTTSQSPRASGGRAAAAAAATVHRSNRHQSRRIVKDLDELLVAEGSQSYDPKRLRSIAEEGQQRSDTRALDLLRSLYTLAGKLGK